MYPGWCTQGGTGPGYTPEAGYRTRVHTRSGLSGPGTAENRVESGPGTAENRVESGPVCHQKRVIGPGLSPEAGYRARSRRQEPRNVTFAQKSRNSRNRTFVTFITFAGIAGIAPLSLLSLLVRNRGLQWRRAGVAGRPGPVIHGLREVDHSLRAREGQEGRNRARTRAQDGAGCHLWDYFCQRYDLVAAVLKSLADRPITVQRVVSHKNILVYTAEARIILL